LFPLFVSVGTSVNILRNRDQLLLGLGLADTYEWYVSFQLVSVCLLSNIVIQIWIYEKCGRLKCLDVGGV